MAERGSAGLPQPARIASELHAAHGLHLLSASPGGLPLRDRHPTSPLESPDMVALLVRIVGIGFLIPALAAAVLDGARSIAGSAVRMTAFGDGLAAAAPEWLAAARAAVAAHVTPLAGPWMSDEALPWLLAQPAWLVLGVAAMVLLLLAEAGRLFVRRTA